jgi:Domain of unknown function (DUF4337)
MTHGHAHEEAEHATHLAHDPFDRRVAMSMVAIAAVLAAVKVLGHRTHNDTLAYQIKAGVSHTQASSSFNFFQAKRQRMELAQLQAAQLLLLVPLSPEKGEAYTGQPLPERDRALKAITKDLTDEQVPGAEDKAREVLAFGDKRFEELRKKGFPVKHAARVVELEMNARRYRLEADAINARAQAERKEAGEYQKASASKHHQADWFDLGELGVELALVLSSVTILTKRRPFWYVGLVLGVIGLVCVGVGFVVK